jgi:plasmid stabilization system protein ParE
MRVEYSLDVEDDLDEIAAYIALDNPRRSVTFLREIHAQIDRIGQGPLLYQLRRMSAKVRVWPWSGAM